MNHAATNRKGDTDSGCLAAICGMVFVGIVVGSLAYDRGFDNGVKAHAAGTHVVNTLADGSQVVTEVKK
jgi:hypothetical protein